MGKRHLAPFSDRYARAREIGYAHLAEEILEISDNSEGDFIERPGKDGEMTKVVDHEAIARARLRVNSRKWMLSKMLAGVSGDRLVTRLTGKDGGPVEIQASSSAIRERIAERLNRITLAAATGERGERRRDRGRLGDGFSRFNAADAGCAIIWATLTSEEYLIDLNANQAAIRAGYTPKFARMRGHTFAGPATRREHNSTRHGGEGKAARDQR